MKPNVILHKILEETYILSNALDVQDIDMVLSTLERRNTWIEHFKTLSFDKADLEINSLILKFDEENQLCIKKMSGFRESMEVELSQVNGQKKKMKQNQKIHDQYSNPYNNGSVGNAFDLKK